MSAIRVDHRPDGVAVLTFDQPGRSANVLTPELWAEFDAALGSVESDPTVRGLVLASAKPGVFIAGADLKFFLNLPGPNAPECRAFVEQGLRVLDRLENLPFPTCAAIDGAALGGGLEVTLACDYRVCAFHPRVSLGLPEVKFGLIPGWGGTQRLSRLVGLFNAEEFLVSGQDFKQLSPQVVGLIDGYDDQTDVVNWACQLLLRSKDLHVRRAIIRSPLMPCEQETFSLQRSPKNSGKAGLEAAAVMVQGAHLPLADAIKLETEAFLRLAGSDESKRLIRAFFEARKR